MPENRTLQNNHKAILKLHNNSTAQSICLERLKFIGLFILKKQAKSHNISLVIKIQPDRKLEREPNLGSRSPLESQNYVVQIHKSIQIIKFIKSRSQTLQTHIQIHMNHQTQKKKRQQQSSSGGEVRSESILLSERDERQRSEGREYCFESFDI